LIRVCKAITVSFGPRQSRELSRGPNDTVIALQALNSKNSIRGFIMKQFVSTLCCCTTFITLANLSSLYADNVAPPAAPSITSTINCSKEELMTFFPQTVVQAVLINQNFSAEDAKAIALELSQKNPELIRIVEEKASKLDPNPFKDLSQRDLGLKIYRETLYEVFSKVLKAHGISDENKIQMLLDEIREAKSKLFIECIRKQQNATAAKPASPM